MKKCMKENIPECLQPVVGLLLLPLLVLIIPFVLIALIGQEVWSLFIALGEEVINELL
jgi:hypothetical protein